MSTTVYFTIEDVNVQLDTYTSIQLESATAPEGSYSLVTTITLVEDQTDYSYLDSVGTMLTWYRYRYYNATGPVASSYSNPFRVSQGNITRAVVRQRAIEDYDCGIVLSAAAGSDANTIKVSDYRIGSTRYSTMRGTGSWLMPSTGTYKGQISNITSSAPTSSPATFELSPDLGGAVATAETIEWHWMVPPDVWNRMINRAVRRYVYVERVPIVGQGAPENDLTYLPWLTKRRQVAGLWQNMLSDYEEQPYSGWWATREDAGGVYLITRPQLETTDTVYMEAYRIADEVFTDDSVLPYAVNWELLAAMAYEEVLKFLTRPGFSAASTDKGIWEKDLAEHRRTTLSRLARRERPRVRYQTPQTATVTKTSTFYRAR